MHALLREKKDGYFIDLAANDAISLSNTRTLEKDHGWRGLCIKPDPQYHSGLLQHRNCTVVAAAVSNKFDDGWFKFGGTSAVSWHGRTGAYSRGVFGHLSRKNSSGESHVWLVPISPILERHAAPSTIDFMYLDVEGSEESVMSKFPFERYNIRLLLIERPSATLTRLLEKHSYVQLCTTELDVLFAHWPSDSLADWVGELHECTPKKPCAPPGACRHLVFPHAPMCRDAAIFHARTRYDKTGVLAAV